MKIIKGDLVKLAYEGHFDVIVHGCNCFNVMGAGIALQIAERFPEAWRADQLTRYADRAKLGSYTLAAVRGIYDNAIIIVNAYTQYRIASTPTDLVVDYDAISRVFNGVVYNLACMNENTRIGIPMIGAGLAGGSWTIISDIIDDAFARFTDPDLLTLVEYDR